MSDALLGAVTGVAVLLAMRGAYLLRIRIRRRRAQQRVVQLVMKRPWWVGEENQSGETEK
jgi:hypothetical protein